MPLLTKLHFINYSREITKSGDSYIEMGNRLSNAISHTIPSRFDGQTARKAAQIAYDVCDDLKNQGRRLQKIGDGVYKKAKQADID